MRITITEYGWHYGLCSRAICTQYVMRDSFGLFRNGNEVCMIYGNVRIFEISVIEGVSRI